MEIELKPCIREYIIDFLIGSVLYFIFLNSFFYFISFVFSELNVFNFLNRHNLHFLIYFLIGFIIYFNVLLLYYRILRFGSMKNKIYKLEENKISEESNFLNLIKTYLFYKDIYVISYEIPFFFSRFFKTGIINLYSTSSNTIDLVMEYIKNVEDITSKISYKILGYDKNNYKLIKKIKPNVKKAIIITFIIKILYRLLIYLFLAVIIFGFFETKFYLYFSILTLLFLFYFFIIFLILKKSFPKYEINFYRDHLEYYYGFLNKYKIIIPYERINNISILQGYFAKKLKYGLLKIDSPGSFYKEIEFDFLELDGVSLDELDKLIKNGRKNRI